jgi:SAM-dependent methyltransferase
MKDLKALETCEGLIVTLNQMGYMLINPEEYNQAFIDFASAVKEPCLEIGAAYGVATLPALARGAYMTANDLSEEHLDILKSKVQACDLQRLILKSGRLPESLNFENESFTGILCSRVLHFIQPTLLQESVNQIFKWLKKGGKFFVLVSSPYIGIYKDYLPIYQKKKREGERWPGLLYNIQDYVPYLAKNLPEFINFFDQDELLDLLKTAGFMIEKVGYSPIDSNNLHTDGREHVGAIAIKP